MLDCFAPVITISLAPYAFATSSVNRPANARNRKLTSASLTMRVAFNVNDYKWKGVPIGPAPPIKSVSFGLMFPRLQACMPTLSGSMQAPATKFRIKN